jgi:hypothetical protein
MAAPEPRLFRYVVWHRSAPQGWLAQIPCTSGLRRQKCVGSAVATQLEAAKFAAGALKVEVDTLYRHHRAVSSARRRPGAKRARPGGDPLTEAAEQSSLGSGWQYVYWHQASKRWECRVGGETLGYHATEAAAAAQAPKGRVAEAKLM